MPSHKILSNMPVLVTSRTRASSIDNLSDSFCKTENKKRAVSVLRVVLIAKSNFHVWRRTDRLFLPRRAPKGEGKSLGT